MVALIGVPVIATFLLGFDPSEVAGFVGEGINGVVSLVRVLTDTGMCYRSHAWRDLLREQDVKHKRARPYRPQTNGKVERFNRTLNEEWAYARLYRSETERRQALQG